MMITDTQTGTRHRGNVLRGIEKAAGTSTGITGLVALYLASAVLQGMAFVLSIPIFRFILEGRSIDAWQVMLFVASIVLAFAAHMTVCSDHPESRCMRCATVSCVASAAR
ncbi:MAG: hypothetical protein L0L01_01485 [Bifidobacterium crudilactis]|nr:hypothetical protein [Bifidobacterium crudilactis]